GGDQRPRDLEPGIPRDVEREGRGRDGGDDHEPTRVRGQLEGDPDSRRDADDREQHSTVMRSLVLLAVLFATPTFGPSPAHAAVSVRVLTAAVVAHEYVTVGDIAVVDGEEPLAGRIRALRFSPAPPPAGRHRFACPAIRAR